MVRNQTPAKVCNGWKLTGDYRCRWARARVHESPMNAATMVHLA
jgi:hypothetical protein